MIGKYLASLAAVVLILSLAASTLQFATRSQVLSGKAVQETWQLEFTLDADSTHTYRINDALKKAFEENFTFVAEGPVRVKSAAVKITPKDVSWTENRQTITAPGADLTAHVQWETPSDSANGARGRIYISLQEIPGLAGKLTFHSGGYQKDDQGRYVLREVTTYRTPFLLSLARFVFAFAVGLPFGIVLHSIYWAFVLKKEKRVRLASLSPQGAQLPRTFYPNPIAEWTMWTIFFGIAGCVGGLIAAITAPDGFISSAMVWVIYIALGVGAAVGLLTAYFTGRTVLTVRVDESAISYARGRGDLQWLSANWSDVLQLTQKSRTFRGVTRRWLELKFKDGRKKLKIVQTIEGYPALRDFVLGVFKQARVY